MPGSVSGSYDPEFGIGSNAADVRMAVEAIRDRVSEVIDDPSLKNIVELVHACGRSPMKKLIITERQFRVLRFALNRALESL